MHPLIAVTGNIATGKSTVVSFFERQYGFRSLSADHIGHELLTRHDVISTLVVQFGKKIVSDGHIDRSALGRIVFNERESLDFLNNLIHPMLIHEALDRLKRMQQDGPVVFEAAVLFEAGWESFFDSILLTTCGKKEQIARVMKRDKRTVDEVKRILSHQISSAALKKKVRWVVDTTNGPATFFPLLDAIASEVLDDN